MNNILNVLIDMPLGSNCSFIKEGSPLSQAIKIRHEKFIKLENLLTQEQKELLEEALEANDDVQIIRTEQKFAHGFHLGAFIMEEIICGKIECFGTE